MEGILIMYIRDVFEQHIGHKIMFVIGWEKEVGLGVSSYQSRGRG